MVKIIIIIHFDFDYDSIQNCCCIYNNNFSFKIVVINYIYNGDFE